MGEVEASLGPPWGTVSRPIQRRHLAAPFSRPIQPPHSAAPRNRRDNEENTPMSYLISAYAITVGTLLLYGISLGRERARLRDEFEEARTK